MKKLLLILLAMLTAGTAVAESIDISAMTNEELKSLQKQIETELDARNRAAASITIPADEDGPITYIKEEDKLPRIVFASEAQLRSRLHKVELTPETARQYLGDYYHAYERYDTNNFGEITGTYEIRTVGFGFTDGYIGQFSDAAMKFTGKNQYSNFTSWDKETARQSIASEEWTPSDEEFVFDIYGKIGKENVHLADYECTAATGTMYLLEVDPIANQWIWEGSPWIDIFVGETDYGDSDTMSSIYNRLNP